MTFYAVHCSAYMVRASTINARLLRGLQIMHNLPIGPISSIARVSLAQDRHDTCNLHSQLMHHPVDDRWTPGLACLCEEPDRLR
jgi:hypothetical protein